MLLPELREILQPGATKAVKVETGATIYAPLFINEGDVIRVDSRTGEYIERMKA